MRLRQIACSCFRKAVRLRQMSTDVSSRTRPFRQAVSLRAVTENEYFYNKFTQRDNYILGKLTSNAETIIDSMDQSSCLYEFLSDVSCRTIEEFNPKLINELVYTLPHLDVRFVHEIMLQAARYEAAPIGSSTVQKTLRNALDRYCMSTLPDSSFRDQLVLTDLWYRCGYHQTSRYFQRVLILQSNHIPRLKHEELVQYLYLANLVRQLPDNATQCIEGALYNILPSLDTVEAASVCQSLYKCRVQLTRQDSYNRLVSIIEKCPQSGEPLEHRVVAAFAKFIRGSGGLPLPTVMPAVHRFVDCMPKLTRAGDWPLETLVRLADVGSQMQLCDLSTVHEAFASLMAELDTCRIKYISMMLFTYSYFNMRITNEQVKRLIERLLNSRDEYKQQYFLVRCTWSLAMMGFYDKRLYVNSFNMDKVTLEPMQLEKLEQESKMPEQSRLQTRLAKEVHTMVTKGLGLKATLECLLPFYIEHDVKVGDNIVVVCHGLTNYYNDKYLTGNAACRARLLRASGYRVVELSYRFHISAQTMEQKTSTIKSLLRPLLDEGQRRTTHIRGQPPAIRPAPRGRVRPGLANRGDE